MDYASGAVTWQQHPRKGGDAFATFLDQIVHTWPDEQVVLVLDNASYHRSPVVRQWWAAHHDRITPYWLPVYSPELNLIERLWRFVKDKLACHRYWNDVAGLDAAIARLLNQVEAHFHADDPPSIYLV